jgi:hypothetical protein
MGLFVGIVPFLLTMAVFTKVALISMPLPRPATTEEEIRTVEQEKFYLKVYLVDDKTQNQVRKEPGIVIDTNALGGGPKFLPLLPEGSYDIIGLNDILLQIKKKNETEKSITLVPGDFIAYETLVHVFDAARETLPELTQNDPELTGVELFPNVVLDKAG